MGGIIMAPGVPITALFLYQKHLKNQKDFKDPSVIA